MNRYDYIVAGAGAAGLSLIMHMIDSGEFTHKTILLVDSAPKTRNDRTWCFWEETPGLFETLVYKKWSTMWFHGFKSTSRLHDIFPYEYKMIRGIDFYNYCFERINTQANIIVKYGVVEDAYSDERDTYLVVEGEKYYAEYVFNSIFNKSVFKKNAYFLWQHFKGWFIETEKEIFNPEEATLMDFRVSQQNDTKFVYVMPFTEKSALIEYTIFSENKLAESEYDEALLQYCQSTLKIKKSEFTVKEEEFGMIGMTNYVFPKCHRNIIYIGTAGGQTKASSGYTFRFIQKHSWQIVDQLIKSNSPHIISAAKKFNFYDTILLKILTERKLSGAHIFTELFEHNEMHKVFKFLDNETSLPEDIKLISTLPKSKFISAAFSHLLQ